MDRIGTFLSKVLMLAIVFTGILGADLHAGSYYYYETFGSAAGTIDTNGWMLSYYMSREFWVSNTYNYEDTSQHMWISNQPLNQRLMIYGDPNSDPSYDQWYTGAGALFRPVSNAQLGRQAMNASAEEPFGYQFVRYMTIVHRDFGTPGYTPDNTGNNDDNYGKGLLEFWMVEDNGSFKYGDSFDNFVFFYDKAFNHNNYNLRTNNIWGYYDQYERDYGASGAWPNLTNEDGIIQNPNLFRKQYSYSPNCTNTNALGVKMVHNGRTVTIYLNPNPLDVTGQGVSNSWIKFAEAPVAWSNNLMAYFCAESPTPEGNNGGAANIYNPTYTEIGDFLMRSVSSNITASVTPTNAVVGSRVTFTLTVTNRLGNTNDSGIGELAIVKPSSFVSNWILTNVSVWNNLYGSLTVTNTNMNPPTGKFSVSTNRNGEMVVRFRMTSKADNQVVTNDNAVITVTFDLFTPANANSTGDSFTVYADCVKHVDTAQDVIFNAGSGLRYATSGRKKAYSADSSVNSLLVKTFGQPQGDGEVSVASIPYYEGQVQATFTYKFDTSRNTNSPDISAAAILIPDIGFTAVSNFDSKILGSISSNYIYYTNYITNVGSNCIYIDYGSASKALAGMNGSDKLTFDVFGTADLPFNVKLSNYQWKSFVNSSYFVAGTTWQQTTNTNLAVKQFITLIAKSPAHKISLTPVSVAINTTASANVISNMSYSILNNGDSGNDILRMAILLPAEFTNIRGFRSSWLGANTNANTFKQNFTNIYSPSNIILYVDYTNVSTNYRLLAASNDVLTFTTVHMITNLDTNAMYREWLAYADNGNTEGYMIGMENSPGHWGMWISPPMPAGESKVVNPLVYTSDITNTITNVVYNTSPLGVNIRMSKTVLPVWFTNVLSVTSSHVSNSLTNIILSNNNGTNVVYVYYQGTNGTVDAGGLLKSVNEVPAEKDTIVIRTLDKIDWNSFTNTNYQLTNLVIQTTVFKTNADVSDTNFYSNCITGTYSLTNYLTVEYPPVSAAFKIETNTIDCTTVTNTLYYTVTNTGMYGNRIGKISITLDPAIVSNIRNMSSSLLGSVGNPSSNVITIDYTSGSKTLWGGSNDLITFDLIDKIDGQKYGPISVYPDVYNDRETVQVTNVISGGSGTLTFDIPKPYGGGGIMPNVYFTGTNMTQTFIATVSNMGQGTDKFQKVQILFPVAFTNRVTNVASQWLGMNSTANPSYVVLTASNVIVIYTNSMIPVGSNDVITLMTAYSNLTVGATNNWSITAFNGYQFLGNDYYELMTNRIIGDTNTYSTEMPDVNITPTNALTTDLSNVFTMTVRNGTNSASRSVAMVKVDIPQPYQSAGLQVNYASGKGFTNYVTNNSAYLSFGTNFTGNTFSTFDLVAGKDYITYPTNVNWTASVYYYGDSDGYRTPVLKGTNTWTVNVVLPNSQSYAAVSPKQVGKDLIKNDYSITITNIGVIGNNALIAKIIPPYTNAFTNIITNINGLSNTLGGYLAYTNGYILVRYDLSNTNLPAKKTDTIFFTAYDNQSLPGFSGQWSVYIGNTTNTNDLVQSQVLLSGDLDFQVIQPGYRTDYRVSPNTVDTSQYTNTLTAIVNNSGGTGNDVKVLRMLLPSPFQTNGIAVSSVLALSNMLTNYGGTNAVEFTYLSNVFITGTNDTITVTAADSLNLGDTNVWIKVSANYYTSELTYVDSDVQVGTNLVQFVQPATAVQAVVLTNEIYSTNKFSIVYRFVNTGQGSNKVTKAYLFIPAIFTNASMGFQVNWSKVSNTNWSWSTGVLRMDYTNFNSGETDTVVLNLTNTVSYETNVPMRAQFFNGQYTNEANCLSVYDTNVNIVNPPSAGVTPSSVLSTDYTNDILVYYNNNTSGNLPTTALRIDLPPVYTNILTATSSNGTAFISNLTVFVTNYSGGSLAKNGSDYVTIRAMDSITKGYSNNIVWKVYADNGTGMGKTRETIFGALKQSFDMPRPNLLAYLDTTWFYVATNTNNVTNLMRIKLVNNGSGANTLNTVKIVFPIPPASPFHLTNVVTSSITNDVITNIAASIKMINSNTMVLYYTNDFPAYGLRAGYTNTLWFNLYYNIQGSGTYPFSIYGENGSSDGYVLASNVAPQTTLLSLVVPEQKSEMYIYDNSTLYTLDTNDVIGYKVNNNSYSFGVQSVWIPFNTNIISNVVRIASTWLGNSNITPVFTNVNSTNGLLIDYGATPLDKRTFDNLSIVVNYKRTTATNMNMAGMIRFGGSGIFEDTLVPEGSTAGLTVEVPDFGRVYGYALPGYLNAGVKVVQTNSDDIITNKFGANVTATADATGYFLLDYIPQGNYDIVIYSSKYKDIRFSGFQVLSNAVTNVLTNIMRHSPINARDSQSQEILSQSDSQTKAVVYPNSILRNFSIDIWLTNMFDANMQKNANNSKTVAKPVDASAIGMFYVDMRDMNDVPMDEQELTNDMLLQFHFTDAEIAAQNWSKNKLAVYYWRAMTQEWVRIGGAVDANNNTVTVKVSYLHKYYAILGEGANSTKVATGFVSVRTDPKVFTPKSGSREYKNVKITIGFDGVVDKYSVKIYNMRGGLVKSYERTGTYGQGEVYWDGKDDDGYDVRGGVYIFRIIAGQNTYSGTIIIAR